MVVNCASSPPTILHYDSLQRPAPQHHIPRLDPLHLESFLCTKRYRVCTDLTFSDSPLFASQGIFLKVTTKPTYRILKNIVSWKSNDMGFFALTQYNKSPKIFTIFKIRLKKSQHVRIGLKLSKMMVYELLIFKLQRGRIFIFLRKSQKCKNMGIS